MGGVVVYIEERDGDPGTPSSSIRWPSVASVGVVLEGVYTLLYGTCW